MLQKQEVYILIIIATIVSFLVGGFLILFVSYFIKKKKQVLLEKELLKKEFSQAILETQLEIQEQTLNHISQEIHDNIGQVLTLAKINIGMIGAVEQQEKLDTTKELVSKAIADLRSLSRSMQGNKIQELGLHSAIAYELETLQKTGLVQTALQTNGTPYPLGDQKEMVLFRIVQEALGNVVKHAKADSVTVSLNYMPNVCTLTIEDDGQGFDITKTDPAKTGIGLGNMKNRAALIEADLQITSQNGGGTTIVINTKAAT